MKKMLNSEHIEGRVYSHNLALKKVQNKESENFGKDFIGGSLDIATDDECLNIVTVQFTYVTPTTSKGNANATFNALKNIIEKNSTILQVGKEAAMMVKVDTALGLNDFYSSKNGEETLVSAKRNEGGFVTIVDRIASNESDRNKFDMDMLINGARYVEADPEKNIEEHLVIKGAVFNFRNAILPVEFVVKNPVGIKYFENLELSQSNMLFTRVWGFINSTVVKNTKIKESAFGDAVVETFEKNVKEWVMTGSAPEPYEIGDEKNGITLEELKKAIEDREIYLAKTKAKQDEYLASKAAAANTFGNIGNAGVSAVQGGFNF